MSKPIYLNYHMPRNKNVNLVKKDMDLKLRLLGNFKESSIERLSYRPQWYSHLAYNPRFGLTSAYRELALDKLGANNRRSGSTSKIEKVKRHLRRYYSLDLNFNEQYIVDSILQRYKDILKDKDKRELYKEIRIPKRKLKDGKTQYRVLQEPNPELKNLQSDVAYLLSKCFGLVPHNASHAYVTGRDNVTNATQHKYSKHVVDMDLENFFDNITPSLIHLHLQRYPVFYLAHLHPNHEIHRLKFHKEQDEILRTLQQKQEDLLEAIVDIATYRNGLPQGSPLSPMLSNLIMFQFDHQIEQILTNKNNNRVSSSIVVYTRYSDNLTFSSSNPIKLDELTRMVNFTLENTLDRNIKLNNEKTKYLKTNRRTYITGVKINNRREVSYGHEKKEKIKKDIFHLFMAYKEGSKDFKQAQETIGHVSYMQRIEPAYTRNLINKYCRKFDVEPKNFYNHFLK